MANNTNLSYPSAFCQQFFDANGKPLTSGKLYTYIAGSQTPVVTYKTISGGTGSANRNTNPIILDMAGMAELVVSTDTAYKFVLFDRNDTKIAEWDNVTADVGGGGGSEDIVVEGTTNEIDVSASVTQGVKHYVISLSNSIKSTILLLIGLYQNVVNSLANKADKVKGATAGDIAALDSDGNLTDSGSKVSDFKTKQTAVPDPSASGTGLEFISSVSQNANGEITPNKKAVQDGTTAQKGVVKLNNSINSSSTTEAATPKAVKDAYDALNNKIIAHATFLSQAEWDIQSQLQGDPAKVYYVENGTGEDAFKVYVWNTDTNSYVEVDESSIDLDGYWHDSPVTTGDGNVVTSITIGNNGVPQVVKGLTALTQHQDISNKLDKTGDASNTTATFTTASTRTNISSGEKLSVLFGKIAKWFSDLKAVAFSGSYNDLSDTPTIPSVPTAYTSNPNMDGTASAGSSNSWSRGDHTHPSDTSKQNTLPYADNKYGISISGSADNLEIVSLGDVNELPIEQMKSAKFKAGTFFLKRTADGGSPYVFGNVTIPNNQWYRFYTNGEQDGYCSITLDIITGSSNTPLRNFKILIDTGVVKQVARVIYERTTSAIGDSETPVYVDANGELQQCSTSKYYMRWNEITPQWITIGSDAALRLWYAKNYCVNYADFELNNSHPRLCYIVCTLPALTSNEIYDLSIEITINGNGSQIQGGTAIFLLDSANSDFTLLSEYAPDGVGGFLNIPQNRITLPANGNSVKYKVYVSGHAYRVARLA